MRGAVVMPVLLFRGKLALAENLVLNPVPVTRFGQVGAEDFPDTLTGFPEQIPDGFCPCVLMHHGK